MALILLIRKRSFTLIEMMVVVSVIIIILALVLPAISTMWEQTHVKNAHHQIENLLKVARARSLDISNIAYGVLFYIHPADNREVAVFIDALTYPIAKDEVWLDVCDRYQVDTKRYFMEDNVRVAAHRMLEWENEDLLNADYRTGKQKNFFAIVFARGRRSQIRPFILYDVDNNDDELGDITGLAVGDTIGEHGGVLRDILIDENAERREISTDWGFVIYDENVFREMSPDYLHLVPYLPYYLTRYGTTVALRRE
ncbi:MAG: pilus assembly FimT family protein [Promethearchaeota archaeon]|jgi:type II secretory pathway pseudopilin PulG